MLVGFILVINMKESNNINALNLPEVNNLMQLITLFTYWAK